MIIMIRRIINHNKDNYIINNDNNNNNNNNIKKKIPDKGEKILNKRKRNIVFTYLLYLYICSYFSTLRVILYLQSPNNNLHLSPLSRSSCSLSRCRYLEYIHVLDRNSPTYAIYI